MYEIIKIDNLPRRDLQDSKTLQIRRFDNFPGRFADLLWFSSKFEDFSKRFVFFWEIFDLKIGRISSKICEIVYEITGLNQHVRPSDCKENSRKTKNLPCNWWLILKICWFLLVLQKNAIPENFKIFFYLFFIYFLNKILTFLFFLFSIVFSPLGLLSSAVFFHCSHQAGANVVENLEK